MRDPLCIPDGDRGTLLVEYLHPAGNLAETDGRFDCFRKHQSGSCLQRNVPTWKSESTSDEIPTVYALRARTLRLFRCDKNERGRLFADSSR